MEVLRDYDAETVHPCHVAANALSIFDLLGELHQLGANERKLLLYASLLHDIGWVVSAKGHHKQSLKIIMEDSRLDFGERERLVIANIARYHRKSFPSEKHRHFTYLKPGDRDVVRTLAAILRLSDGMDYMHRSGIFVEDCTYDEKMVTFTCSADSVSIEEEKKIQNKSALFREVFGRLVRISWTKIPQNE